MNRRQFCFASVGCLTASACNGAPASAGLLRTRAVGNHPRTALSSGTHTLGIRTKRDAVLYVPKTTTSTLVLYLHGAGGSEEQGPRRFGTIAEKLGFLLLSPASEGRTWDAIRDGFGPDIPNIDAALSRTIERAKVDRIIVAGFSDGASYALGLGLRNTALFHGVAAFSPGFIAGGAGEQREKARLFISHGTEDEILPIDSCSRQIVPRLKSAGHTVRYREFAGPHMVPPEIAEEVLGWAISTSNT